MLSKHQTVSRPPPFSVPDPTRRKIQVESSRRSLSFSHRVNAQLSLLRAPILPRAFLADPRPSERRREREIARSRERERDVSRSIVPRVSCFRTVVLGMSSMVPFSSAPIPSIASSSRVRVSLRPRVALVRERTPTERVGFRGRKEEANRGGSIPKDACLVQIEPEPRNGWEV